MITTIKFKAGVSVAAPGIELITTPITVFVGPNNSGKSQALLELYILSCQGYNGGSRGNIILENVNFRFFTEEEILEELAQLGVTFPINGNPYGLSIKLNTGGVKTASISFKSLIAGAAGHPSQGDHDYPNFRSLYTLLLDGKNRLALLDEQVLGDLQESSAKNNLSHLFRDDVLREEVRRIVFEALGMYFVIDPTNGGKLRVKLSNRTPSLEEEKSLTEAAINFYRDAISTQEIGDGIRAFIGIIVSLIAGKPRITLIDEPEAFLHPALAMKLGKEICRSVRGANRLFASTHSAAFLMGCIQSGSPVNIVRLTYEKAVGTTRILAQDKLLHLMRNPLLRSAGLLDGLFHEVVVITEAPADRAFYQEINERLRTLEDPRSINSCLFINGNGKHTIWEMLKPLRELGIPAIGIVDLDVIKDGVMTTLQSAFVPGLQQRPMTALSASIRSALDAATPSGEDWKTSGGLNLLSGELLESANNYFDILESYGIFTVRSGELESWLSPLGISRDKKKWLRRIFERMGEDSISDTYVRPAPGDVWDFIGRMRQWAQNPMRKGIPE